MTCSCLIWSSNPLSSSKLNRGGWINSDKVSLQGENSMGKPGGTTLPFVSLLNTCPCTLHCTDHLKWRDPCIWDLWVYHVTDGMPLLSVPHGPFLVLIPILQQLDTSEIKERCLYVSFTHLWSLFLVAHPSYSLVAAGKSPGYSTCINPRWRGQQSVPLGLNVQRGSLKAAC